MSPRTWSALAFSLLLVAAACQQHDAPATSTTGTPAATATTVSSTPMPPACTTGTCPNSTCMASLPASAPAIPQDACQKFEGSQTAVDTFAWNEFIALNWPADPKTCATVAKSIADVRSNDNTVVLWQTWMPGDKVFVDPASQPAAWCQGNALAGGARELTEVAKADDHFHELGGAFTRIAEPDDVKQAAGGVLTDQQGRWLRYERLMNQDEYNYIKNNGLWKLDTLKQWNAQNKPIDLPNGTTSDGPTGAMEIKAAWKVLSDQEVAQGRYFTTTATVYNDAEGSPSPGKNPVTLGLVGLHIIHKTPTQDFFWSTFEHVDNDRVFYNPNSTTQQNTQTAKQPYVELKPDGTPNNAPVQVVRTNKDLPQPEVKELNAWYQRLLGNSVFRNYRLISTQWGTGGAPQGTPPDVANIVLETFVQDLKNSKNNATGCLACHLDAHTRVPGQLSDHSFFFRAAK